MLMGIKVLILAVGNFPLAAAAPRAEGPARPPPPRWAGARARDLPARDRVPLPHLPHLPARGRLHYPLGRRASRAARRRRSACRSARQRRAAGEGSRGSRSGPRATWAKQVVGEPVGVGEWRVSREHPSALCRLGWRGWRGVSKGWRGCAAAYTTAVSASASASSQPRGEAGKGGGPVRPPRW